LTVNPIPTVTIQNLASIYYNNDPNVNQLLGTPIGGEFEGPGISYNKFFSPLGLTPGIYNITYYYNDPTTGCSNFTVQSTRVVHGTVPVKDAIFFIATIAIPVLVIVGIIVAILVRRRQKNKYKLLELGVDFGSRDINTNIEGGFSFRIFQISFSAFE
jgi:hypothetical protein